MHDFMCQLLYTPHTNIIVVGHSHFFREVFGNYLSSTFRERQPDLAHQLTEGKMMNCGLVRLLLDPMATIDEPGIGHGGNGCILDAQLVLGTHMLLPKPPRRCCLCQRRATSKPLEAK